MAKRDYSVVTPEVKHLTEVCVQNSNIDPELYTKLEVKRGLRDLNGKGVLTGLTEISDIIATKEVEGEVVPCEGSLYYRGYNVVNLIEGFHKDNRFGFEEVAYLLLMGSLPTKEELENFKEVLVDYRSLPNSFVRDIILKAPSPDVMNSLARSVLTLYSFDKEADNTNIDNVMRQCLQLIAEFPMLIVYAYNSYRYYRQGENLIIHRPKAEYSAAENILHLLRPDGQFTDLEAKVLDTALVLHMEHGGGNNSTFTTHVVTSSGTDTYSAIAAALGSLKGPKHGGANVKVTEMFTDLMAQVKNWEDESEVEAYLKALLHKQAFDKSGLIYGMGHAIYSVSDPRALVLHDCVAKLAEEKGMDREYALYSLVERLAPKVIAEERKIYKGVSANVDFFSGLLYQILGLPNEIYTALFATARIVGWSAHRIEELINAGKIIRPAYVAVQEHRDYVPMEER